MAERQRMLMRVGLVWHRFLYSSHPLFNISLAGYVEWYRQFVKPDHSVTLSYPEPRQGIAHRPSLTNDAFGTVIQWLYHRINATR